MQTLEMGQRVKKYKVMTNRDRSLRSLRSLRDRSVSDLWPQDLNGLVS